MSARIRTVRGTRSSHRGFAGRTDRAGAFRHGYCAKGIKLDALASTGDLGDCYKLYFDPDGSDKPRFRLVYRHTPDEISAVAIESVAVGRRDNLDAYTRAVRNLGR